MYSLRKLSYNFTYLTAGVIGPVSK